MDYSITLRLPDSLPEHLPEMSMETFIQQIVDEALEQKLPTLLKSAKNPDWEEALSFLQNHRSFPLHWEQNKLNRDELNER